MVSLADTDLVFGALAHEARRSILLILTQLGDELPAGYLAARFGHSWPTTTRHLGVLQKAGLLSVRREGRGILYRIERERLSTVVLGWLALLAPTTPDKTWKSSGPKTTRKLQERKKP